MPNDTYNDTYNVPHIAATLVKRLIRLRPETLRDIVADLPPEKGDFLRDGALLALHLQELQVGDENIERIVQATLGSLV